MPQIAQPTISDYPGLREDGEAVPGVEITLGRYCFLLPPLAVTDMEAALVAKDADGNAPIDRLNEMLTSGVINVVGMQLLFGLLTKALARNYPDITEEVIRKYLDVANMRPVIRAMFSANDLEGQRPTVGATA